MTRPERDLVAAIRAELAGMDPSRVCDRAAERSGLAMATVARDPALARLWVRLGRELVGPTNVARRGVRDFDWAAAAGHCRAAWLRGVFLARGSLSLAGGRAHLEFIVESDEAVILAARLTEFGLRAGSRLRRRRGVVTSKNGDAISEFLRRIGANATLLELEARQVARSLHGEINRVINAESANLRRTVWAAGRQLDAIGALQRDGRLTSQPPVVRRVAAARVATPEASISELSSRLTLHRSSVQRALERLERLAGLDESSARAASGRPLA